MYDYTKNLKWSKLRVGLLLTAALFVIFAAVIFAPAIGSRFEHTVIVYSDFPDIKGLTAGAPIRLSGVEIGNVKGVRFRSAGVVRVSMSIKEDYLRLLTRDSVAAVNTLGILGEKYIEVSAGTDGRLAPGGVIAGTTPFDIQKIAGSGNAAIAKLEEVAGRLDHTLNLIENGKGSAAKFIKDPSLYDNVNASAKGVADIVAMVKKSDGTVNALIANKSLYENVDASSKKLSSILDRLDKGEGALGGLTKDGPVSSEVEQAITNLDASSRKLSSILDRIDKGEGTLGGLTKDGRVSRELEQTITDLRALINDIKEHPKKYIKIHVF